MQPDEIQLEYVLPAFEGPLDLLLNLIAKNKIDIYDIPILELIEQYMKHIDKMKEEDMDITAEFLEMASRLTHIKSVMLLPKHEEEEDDLKKELVGQLIEYQLCRETAEKLSKIVTFDTFIREASPVEFDLTYNRTHNKQEISDAFISAVGRGKRRLPPPEEAFSGIVERKIISVRSKIIYVMRRLWRGSVVKYKELFMESKEKSELVATFLAVLELVKGKRIRINGDGKNAKVKMINKKNDKK